MRFTVLKHFIDDAGRQLRASMLLICQEAVRNVPPRSRALLEDGGLCLSLTRQSKRAWPSYLFVCLYIPAEPVSRWGSSDKMTLYWQSTWEEQGAPTATARPPHSRGSIMNLGRAPLSITPERSNYSAIQETVCEASLAFCR
jgi:hypothetical protein